LNNNISRTYGYFSDSAQLTPAYDPGLTAPCLICGLVLDAIDVRTVSLMIPEDSRSYFYRVHRSCHEPLSEAERIKIDGLLVEAVYSARNTN